MHYVWVGFSGMRLQPTVPSPRGSSPGELWGQDPDSGQREPTGDTVFATVSPRLKVTLGLKKEQETSVHRCVGKERRPRPGGRPAGLAHQLFSRFQTPGDLVRRFPSSALTDAHTW